MICPNCGRDFRLARRCTGASSPPGHFFYAAVTLVLNTALLFALGPWGPPTSTLRGLWIALLVTGLAGTTLALWFSCTVAILDQYRPPGRWPTCPDCDTEKRPWPWSL